ncbi:hypothetical protein Prudu_000543 [Prunus dulcis]|uniref:Uncharacterized protein n=1 Tax=Prunus dulcis TaxID=3755 RepID=A0A4Y1QLG4_PRUDU|nr:hypothetical protein Prudu_000543 [Prunus dulcis]
MQSPVVATKFHCTKSAICSTGHCKKRTTTFHFKFTRSSTFRIQRFNLACHNRNPENHLVTPWSSAIFPRGIRNCTECINVSWRWVSQVISFYLFCLNLVADAVAIDYPSPSFVYACEDVNNYYANADHLEGKSLKKKLNSIIARHQSLSYREVWNALKLLDASDVDNPKASSGIVEIYSLRVVPKSLAGKPEGWNREHLWPRSYGLKDGPSLTDLHNIRPADVNVNSSRGNKYYGECDVYSTKCLKPANKEAALDTETDKDRWAPPKQWNEIDPPSREEKLRNERVCRFYQHNRNPFVDHPEYASLIWEERSSLRLPRSHEIHNKRQFKTSQKGFFHGLWCCDVDGLPEPHECLLVHRKKQDCELNM